MSEGFRLAAMFGNSFNNSFARAQQIALARRRMQQQQQQFDTTMDFRRDSAMDAAQERGMRAENNRLIQQGHGGPPPSDDPNTHVGPMMTGRLPSTRQIARSQAQNRPFEMNKIREAGRRTSRSLRGEATPERRAPSPGRAPNPGRAPGGELDPVTESLLDPSRPLPPGSNRRSGGGPITFTDEDVADLFDVPARGRASSGSVVSFGDDEGTTFTGNRPIAFTDEDVAGLFDVPAREPETDYAGTAASLRAARQAPDDIEAELKSYTDTMSTSQKAILEDAASEFATMRGTDPARAKLLLAREMVNSMRPPGERPKGGELPEGAEPMGSYMSDSQRGDFGRYANDLSGKDKDRYAYRKATQRFRQGSKGMSADERAARDASDRKAESLMFQYLMNQDMRAKSELDRMVAAGEVDASTLMRMNADYNRTRLRDPNVRAQGNANEERMRSELSRLEDSALGLFAALDPEGKDAREYERRREEILRRYVSGSEAVSDEVSDTTANPERIARRYGMPVEAVRERAKAIRQSLGPSAGNDDVMTAVDLLLKYASTPADQTQDRQRLKSEFDEFVSRFR